METSRVDRRVRETVARYVATYLEPDAGLRRAALADVWAEDGVIVYEGERHEGIEALAAFAEAFRAGLPGMEAILTSRLDEHAGVGHFAWRVLDGEGTSLAEGWDVVDFTVDGRLARVATFLGIHAELAERHER